MVTNVVTVASCIRPRAASWRCSALPAKSVPPSRRTGHQMSKKQPSSGRKTGGLRRKRRSRTSSCVRKERNSLSQTWRDPACSGTPHSGRFVGDAVRLKRETAANTLECMSPVCCWCCAVLLTCTHVCSKKCVWGCGCRGVCALRKLQCLRWNVLISH